MSELRFPVAGEIVYQNCYQRVWQISLAVKGTPREYFVIDYGPRAGIAVLREADILLICQY